jgi:hypothetical protein
MPARTVFCKQAEGLAVIAPCQRSLLDGEGMRHERGPFEDVREAERIVRAAGCHLQERTVLDRLAGTVGVACARLEPRSEVIQLDAYDGEHLGQVRRETNPGQVAQWVSVLKDRALRIGTYPSAIAAAEAIAQAYGKGVAKVG